MGGHGGEVEVPHDESDPFVKKVALSVAVFAVVLALAAAGGNNAGKDMMMSQMQASNEWNRYQAKVQREVLYAQEREELEQAFGPLTPEDSARLARRYEEAQKDRARLPADAAERKRLRLGHVTAKLAEYAKEKEELSATARGFQSARDLAHKRDPFFDLAELLLQIAIVLASVSMLSKARWAYLGGCVLAAGGLALTVCGYFFPDVPLPLLGAEAGGH